MLQLKAKFRRKRVANLKKAGIEQKQPWNRSGAGVQDVILDAREAFMKAKKT